MSMKTDVRPAKSSDLDRLAAIWHDAWHETHAPLMPAELGRLRTLGNFRDRLGAILPGIMVAEVNGALVGFCITRDDELYQLYFSPGGRGTGAAAALLSDAERRIAAHGYKSTWLACAVGNTRAAKFYEKWGWALIGTVRIEVETGEGPFPVDVWRYEKILVR